MTENKQLNREPKTRILWDFVIIILTSIIIILLTIWGQRISDDHNSEAAIKAANEYNKEIVERIINFPIKHNTVYYDKFFFDPYMNNWDFLERKVFTDSNGNCSKSYKRFINSTRKINNIIDIYHQEEDNGLKKDFNDDIKKHAEITQKTLLDISDYCGNNYLEYTMPDDQHILLLDSIINGNVLLDIDDAKKEEYNKIEDNNEKITYGTIQITNSHITVATNTETLEY